MSNKLTFKFTGETFADFLTKLKDLSSIDPTVKLKIDKNHILMYTMIAKDSTVTALKSYALITSEFIEYDNDTTLDYVILNAPKVVKSLRILSCGEDVKLDVVYKKDNECLHVRTGLFTSGKLKISCIGGELYKIRDVTHPILESKFDPDLAEWNFVVNKDDFINIKKLSSIYTEDKILDININEGVVVFAEPSKWELNVGTSEDLEYHNLTFLKKYLSNIDDTKEDIVFYIYDTYILIKDDISNLMLSYEQSWDD